MIRNTLSQSLIPCSPFLPSIHRPTFSGFISHPKPSLLSWHFPPESPLTHSCHRPAISHNGPQAVDYSSTHPPPTLQSLLPVGFSDLSPGLGVPWLLPVLFLHLPDSSQNTPTLHQLKLCVPKGKERPPAGLPRSNPSLLHGGPPMMNTRNPFFHNVALTSTIHPLFEGLSLNQLVWNSTWACFSSLYEESR